MTYKPPKSRTLWYSFSTPGTQVEEELSLLRKYKAKALGQAAAHIRLEAWDRLYYMRIAQVRAVKAFGVI